MPERRTELQFPRHRPHEAAEERIESAHLRQPPDFIIIGAQKGGTTSLNRYLRVHPDIGMSITGEVNFFSWRYSEGLAWYLAHFPLRGEVTVVGVSSPSYLLHPKVPERVRDALPHVKLIALLRNPVDRAYSHYQMSFRKGIEPLSFEEAIAAEPDRLRDSSDWSDLQWRKSSYVSYLSRGVYADQLQRWLSFFQREQLLVLKSETLFGQPDESLRRTFAFLGLQPQLQRRYEVSNSGVYEPMRPGTRERLTEYFAPHNRRLYELLGEDFDWDAN
jgi:hypothetical protein